jgi:hypothetical protein
LCDTKPVKVMAKCCDQCLFGKNKLVSHTRRKQIIDKCSRTGRTFECHKATIADKKVMCHAFFNLQVKLGNMLCQVAQRLGLVEYVEEEQLHLKDGSQPW